MSQSHEAMGGLVANIKYQIKDDKPRVDEEDDYEDDVVSVSNSDNEQSYNEREQSVEDEEEEVYRPKVVSFGGKF